MRGRPLLTALTRTQADRPATDVILPLPGSLQSGSMETAHAAHSVFAGSASRSYGLLLPVYVPIDVSVASQHG